MSFTLNISKFVAKAKGKTDLVVRKVVIGLGAKVIEKTPVGDRERWAINKLRASKGLPPIPEGYVGGAARSNWQYQHGTLPTGKIEQMDASGASAIAGITAGVQSHDAAGIHYIANSLSYINALENGHSTQAPNGMVGLTVAEFESVVREAAK